MKLNKLLLTIIALLALALVACGEKEDSNVINVAIVQIIDNSAFTEMREGFIDQMRANGYSEKDMVFHIKDAQGDATVLNSIAQEVVNGDYDVLVAIATPAAQALVNLESEKPVFFISIMNPIGARLTSSLTKPDKNSTGSSNEVPHSKIFELSKNLTPEVKSYGLLYSPNEVNAVTVINEAKKYLNANNIPYQEAIIASAGEAQQAALSLADSVDAIFVPVDSIVQSAMASIAEVAIEAKLPLYSCSLTNIMSGAFATLATADSVLGSSVADMVTEYLNGALVADMPVAIVPATELFINADTAESINVSIPEELNATLIKK